MREPRYPLLRARQLLKRKQQIHKTNRFENIWLKFYSYYIFTLTQICTELISPPSRTCYHQVVHAKDGRVRNNINELLNKFTSYQITRSL
ncbi:hypothetical protein KSP40_PGU008394 [Platanthera guangdongensis]|uniref:Uncharacterized protein n=1 Tax=Platanthera guangdongensis TaxID=2320717 RepID=A0ABR2M1M0_9ASPA